MTTPDNAWADILRRLRPLPATLQPLEDVRDACLAENIRADRDIPPANRSAMDGYAVRSADMTGGPCTLRLAGEVAAGSPARPRVARGTCVRILTGGNLPPGADTVVMVEATKEANGQVSVLVVPDKGANILKRAEDTRKGTVLLERGVPLRSCEIGVCAMVGKAKVRVHRKPRVALVCTGAELRNVEAKVRSHEIRNTNGPAIAAALAEWGFSCGQQEMAPDRLDALVKLIRRLVRSSDTLLLTGGMSVGKYDLVREALEKVGATIHLHGVAMKPGKPFLFATMPGGLPVFGMPGTPLGALTGFHEFVMPALRRLSGMSPAASRPLMRLPLAGPVKAKGGRVRLMLARVIWGDAGPCVGGVDSHSSSDLASAARADGVIVIPADVREMKVGEIVDFRPWRPLS